VLLKMSAKIAKGAADPKRESVGKVSAKQVKEIAELKFKDLNCVDIDAAIRTVEGTARSMGIEVTQ
jgi:large subunit ribosomal protein L11